MRPGWVAARSLRDKIWSQRQPAGEQRRGLKPAFVLRKGTCKLVCWHRALRVRCDWAPLSQPGRSEVRMQCSACPRAPARSPRGQ